MRKKLPSVTVCVVLVFTMLVSVDMGVEVSHRVRAATIYVGGVGPGNYSKVQEGIDAANPGDTVYVHNGTYYESVLVNKTINLVGENKDSTIINGSGNVLEIFTDGANISGFTITNGYNGIWLYCSSNNRVSNNNISNNRNGIYLMDSTHVHSANNLFENNTIFNNKYGFNLERTHDHTITGNVMVGNGIYIHGEKIEHWNSHTINASNSVNGKPVYFWKDRNGGTVPSGAGEVILANCQNVTVEGQELTTSSVGLELGFSWDNRIMNNTISDQFLYGVHLFVSSGNLLKGNNVSHNDKKGIHLEYSSNNNVSFNIINHNYDGLFLEYSSNNTLFNNIISHNRDHGIDLIDYCNNNYIAQNNASYNYYGSFLIGRYCDVNTITGNIASHNYYAGGLSTHHSDGNIITGNDFSMNPAGIYLMWSDGFVLENNLILINGEYGILVYESSSGTIAGNTMTNSSIFIRGDLLEHWNTHNISTTNSVNGKPVYYWKDRTGGTIPPGAGEVILANCSNIEVKNKNFSNGSVGIQLGFSSYNNISHNNISDNSYGLFFRNSSKNRISYNNIFSNIHEGFYLRYSNRNNIKYNKILNNSYGLKFFESSFNNVTFNNFSKNECGLWFDSTNWFNSSRNILIGNTIYRNNMSMFFSSYSGNSDDNILFHNNFINNTDQITTNRNQWNESYPIGGNYWSDYYGSDNFTGPNQDIPGSDGIGDTPHGWDFYPLMQPFQFYNQEDVILLNQGWNLISLPTLQNDTDIQSVLQSIEGDYDAVQWYDMSDSLDPWKHYHASKSSLMNDLTDINHTMGLWVHVIKSGGTVFLPQGDSPTINQSINLHLGWNMVGYPSTTNRLRDDALGNLDFGSDVDAIQYYDTQTGTIKYLEENDYMKPGMGYWIHATTSCVWEVPL